MHSIEDAEEDNTQQQLLATSIVKRARNEHLTFIDESNMLKEVKPFLTCNVKKLQFVCDHSSDFMH